MDTFIIIGLFNVCRIRFGQIVKSSVLGPWLPSL